MDHEEKCLARELVQAAWRYKTMQMKKAGATMVYPNQELMACEILAAYYEGVSLVTLVASPQWGKTGVALSVIYQLTTHIDVDRMIHPEHVYILTGMSDCEWKEQTKERMLDMFKDSVYHQKNLQDLVPRLAQARDAFLLIDECHIGNGTRQTLGSVLRRSGIMDIRVLRERNIKLLCVSATPANIIADAMGWGAEHHRMIVESGLHTKNYVGFHTLLAENRVRMFVYSGIESFGRVLEDIHARWDTPRYHVIRADEGTQMDIRSFLDGLGDAYAYQHHDSRGRIADVEKVLRTPPTKHTFILIKSMWRAAKTLPDEHVGVNVETSSSKDSNVVAQGLAGRMLGFGKQTGDKAPVYYGNRDALENYVRFLDAGADFQSCERYQSALIHVKEGVVRKKKDSHVHPSVVRGLPARTDAGAPSTARPLPRRVGVVKRVPRDAVLATRYETLTRAELEARFGVRVPSGAKSGGPLHHELARKGVAANVSFAKTAMKQVANLKNYYTTSWADAPLHVLRVETDRFVLIHRDAKILDRLERGEKVVVHNGINNLVLYEMV